MVPLDGGKSQRSRGGGGRAQRAQSMGGALGPAHALVLRVWGALGPPRPAKPKHGRGQGPRPCFVRAVRARRPPGNAGIFLRPREPFANLFSPRKPTNKTSPPLPVSGGPAYAVGKPKKDSSKFSPAFLKAGQGVWGAGSPPHGVPGGRALQKAYYTLKRKSTTSPSCMT